MVTEDIANERHSREARLRTLVCLRDRKEESALCFFITKPEWLCIDLKMGLKETVSTLVAIKNKSVEEGQPSGMALAFSRMAPLLGTLASDCHWLVLGDF